MCGGRVAPKMFPMVMIAAVFATLTLAQNRGGGEGPNRRRVEPQGRTGSGNDGGSGLFFDYYGDVYDDMESGDDGEGSGGGGGGGGGTIVLGPGSSTVILRFRVVLLRKWEAGLEDSASTQFASLASSVVEKIEGLYQTTSGQQFATLATIQPGSQTGELSAVIDLLSKDNSNVEELVRVLGTAVRSGQLDGVSPNLETDWWRQVINGLEMPGPLPQPPGCRADTQIACPGSARRICDDQRCDGVEDCPKAEGELVSWDESGDCIPDEIPTAGTSTTAPPSPPPTTALKTTTTPATTTTIAPVTTVITTPRICEEGEFTCLSNGMCIDQLQVCDKIADCADLSDEIRCPCDLTTEWTCADSSCVLLNHKCDGLTQCPDGSDESSCCPRGHLRCAGGDCVPPEQVCDGKEDCPLAEDEKGCPVCRSDQLVCLDSSCVDSSLLCNGVWDCPSGEDEQACPTQQPSCSSIEIRCPSGKCAVRCDGRRECTGGEDEADCCKQEEFTCLSGECIDSTSECNGQEDCRDGSDEHSLCAACLAGQFRCGDGRCVDGSVICDGKYDCIDAADERDCALCGATEWRCEGGACIPLERRCDGIQHCQDGTDELDCPALPIVAGCTSSQFSCGFGSTRCLTLAQRCDRIPDCPDGSDEKDCGCGSTEFTCSDSSCIETWRKCDGRQDCQDGGDESVIECGRCRLGEFKCANGAECIAERERCDGQIHCGDGSDERNCPLVPYGALNLRTYPTEQTIKEGREVVFQCRDEGSLRAAVAWRRGNGLPLPPNTRDLEGRLELPDIKVTEAGTYICFAIGYAPSTPGSEISVYLQVEQYVPPTTRPPTACGLSEATCANGECIDRSQVCDGRRDCRDGSDESGCRAGNDCEPNEFQCDNKRCVLKTWRCDGDDDCGDGSDESRCNQGESGNQCRYYEWECASRDQCIPRSFHCDGEMDCQDQSDEIGCSSPIIVISPPPAIIVEQTFTFIINCTAMGIPTPEIVWRLNWGHVPDKCQMTSSQQEGNRAYGELTCPNALPSDSGAYSCEAINSMGSCFAGSAGCGQPGQDAILVVNVGGLVCPAGEFNLLAASRSDCLKCFCFGLTDSCSSADLYLATLPPPAGIFQLVSLDTTSLASPTTTLDTSFLKSLRGGGQTLYVRSLAALGEAAGRRTPFFSLPASHTGNQIKSYGGELRFQISYRGEGSPIPGPLVILQGDGLWLSYHHEERLRPGAVNNVAVRFWPGQWYRGGGKSQLATRAEILRVLARLERVLVRAQHLPSGPIDTTLEEISMDTADIRDSGRGATSYIEQCICPPGYSGLSCESCAPGFQRTDVGACARPGSGRSCPPGYYGDPDSGLECAVCPCPLTTPSNQFGRECYLDADRQVTCRCATGYAGRRCGECEPGYVGNPARPGGNCQPGPPCNYPAGSLSETPDPASGKCSCKAGWSGESCRQLATSTPCQESQFLSKEKSVPGCINCFCMGIPSANGQASCKPSQLFRDKEKAVFQDDSLGFSITDQYLEASNSSTDLVLNAERRELTFLPGEPGDSVYYWRLPHQFLGSKLTAYGGYLEFNLRFEPEPHSEEQEYDLPLVEIMGNDIRLVYTSQPIEKTTASGYKYRVLINEKEWSRVGGGSSNREHMLMALANLDHILIRAVHSPATAQASISEVSLDCAVGRNTGQDLATAVEGCDCPPGYKGLSCEECAPGYTRSGRGYYLGTCVRCSCNGKSASCDPVTGTCLDCRDFTAGERCEECLPGFYKDPGTGGCRPESGASETCSCDPRGSLELTCPASGFCRCKANVEGRNCDLCRPGTFHLAAANPAGCSACFCSGVTEECSEARLFWSTLRLAFYDQEHGVVLTDAERRVSRKEEELTYLPDSYELSYVEPAPGRGGVHFWSMPHQFTGSKTTAYGGNLTVIQRYVTERGREDELPLNEPAVIIRGGGLTLKYAEENLARVATMEEQKYKVELVEAGWRVQEEEEGDRPASRQDMLTALAAIESILIRATVTSATTESYLRKVMLDIAVPQLTGGPLAAGAEECRCPPGYAGYSCESCALGFYRDTRDRSRSPSGSCVRCPCSNSEDSCQLLPTGQVQCSCRDGWSGPNCQHRGGVEPLAPPASELPILVTISEPRIQLVEVGSTVSFNCDAMPRFRAQDPLTIAWARENGLLPAGRASDDGRGLLIITAVRAEDSGIYICTATSGQFVATQSAQLTVGDPSPAVTVSIQPAYRQASSGERVELDCSASGTPSSSLSWSRPGGVPLGPRTAVRGGKLTVLSAGREDEGEYICTATTPSGSAQARAQIYVRSAAQIPEIGGNDDIPNILIEPLDLSIGRGDSAQLTCRLPSAAGGPFVIRWEAQEAAGSRLPASFSQADGVLTIRQARPEDSGIYVCRVTASRSGAVQEAQARLTVLTYRGPPTVRIEPEEQTIGQGGRAELRCLATGDPPPVIVWSKVGEELTSPNLAVSGARLNLRSAAVSDRGMYICTAENPGGSARASAIIEVERREPPAVEIYPESFQTVNIGGSVLFQCRTVAGIPTPLVTWTRADGRPFQPNVEQLGGGVIRINRLTGGEAGQYNCKASNEAGVAEATATLVTQEAPTIELTPRGSVSLRAGSKMSLECVARGDPRPAVTWKKVGMTSRQVGPSAPRFEISRLSKEDEGTYACVARNEAGEAEERVQIIVLDEDEYYPEAEEGRYPGGQDPYPGGQDPYPIGGGGSQDPGRYPGEGQFLSEEIPVSIGGTIRLECLAVGSLANLYAQWKRTDGRRLAARHYQRDGTLFLVTLEKEDEGEYTCEVVDNRGTVVYEIKKQIFLKSPPKIRLEPPSQTVNPGDSPVISCSATGQQPISLVWVREDRSPLPRTVTQNRGQLQFRGISVSDEGRYICRATNSDGEAEATAQVFVNDLASSSNGGNLQAERISVSAGTPVDLPCRLPPAADLTWSRDGGAALPPYVVLIRNVLRFERVGESDSGRYTCTSQGRTQYVDLSVEPAFECARDEFACYDMGGCVPRGQLCDGEYDCTDGSDELTCPRRERRKRGVQLSRRRPVFNITASTDRPLLGAGLDLTCQVRGGEPRGTVLSWNKVGEPLPPNAVTRGNLLRFESLNAQNEGLYRCKADTRNGIFYEDYTLVAGSSYPTT